MSINIQLVEIPENEQVSSRQISLPPAGGTIGRAYDCTIQLPDFSKSLSRVHAQVSRDEQGRYQVVNKSTNGMQVNDKVLSRGQYHAIGDGDIWKIGDYLLLVTDLSVLAATDADVSQMAQKKPLSEPLFSVDEFDVTDAQVVEAEKMRMREDIDMAAMDHEVKPAKMSEKSSGFSAQNALGEVQLGIDPFEDEQMQPSTMSNHVTVESQGGVTDTAQQNLQQLTMLLAQQRNNSDPHSYDTLMQCIQTSMDKFIEEMAPEYLEEMFNGYITGWGNKDKKYWQLYKKQFKRKMARREFHRQFASIFMEELRGKN